MHCSRLLLAVCLLCIAAAPAGAETATELDARLLGACIDAIHAREAENVPFSGAKQILVDHDAPVSEAGIDGETLRQELHGLPVSELAVPLADLHARFDAGWKPPAKIPTATIPARVRRARPGWWSGSRPFLIFWPPGIDHDSGTALVVAAMGPAAHGAKAACHLEGRDGHWAVRNAWTAWFL